MSKYSQEVRAFILSNYAGISVQELTDRINAAFGTTYTIGQIRSYKKNHALRSGVKPGCRAGARYSDAFPKEVCDYIYSHYMGVGHKDMTLLLAAHFAREYKASQIKSFYANHHLNCGLSGHFPKGHVPYNRGRKGTCAAGCEKSWFPKSHIPHNHLPVGTELIKNDGYWWVKIADPNKWRQKHLLVWEAAHGKRPAGHVVIFLDGDHNNATLENLSLIARSEHVTMTKLDCRSSNPEITRIGINLARLKMAATGAKKRKARTARQP